MHFKSFFNAKHSLYSRTKMGLCHGCQWMSCWSLILKSIITSQRVRAIRFVCLHFDHHGFVRQVRRVAAFRSLVNHWGSCCLTLCLLNNFSRHSNDSNYSFHIENTLACKDCDLSCKTGVSFQLTNPWSLKIHNITYRMEFPACRSKGQVTRDYWFIERNSNVAVWQNVMHERRARTKCGAMLVVASSSP